MEVTEDLRRALVEAVRAAAVVCRAVQADLRTGETLTKPDESPVTVADLASQAVIARRLADAFPDLPLTAEEDASTLAGPDRAELRRAVVSRVSAVWKGATEDDVLRALARGSHPGGAAGRFLALDPIDGTKGFLRGEQYAVALALVEDGRVVAGVLGCPNLAPPGGARGVIVHAAFGAGCRATPLGGSGADRPVRVSVESDPARLRLCESVEVGHSDRGASDALRARLRVAAPPVRMDSQAKYALLALGGGEVYLRTPTREDRREWIWDHAAGAIVVEEAGGRVTDVTGAPLDFGRGRRLEANRGVVATNGRLHHAVLAALRDAGAAPRPGERG
jgi:3'(2'), 5'-bisphosphate nucleotidase